MAIRSAESDSLANILFLEVTYAFRQSCSILVSVSDVTFRLAACSKITMDPRRVKTWGPLEVPLDTYYTMDYDEPRRPPEAWMMDYERTRRHLETWTTVYEEPHEPLETWTKDNGQQREDEQRENLIKPEKSDDYISGVRLILVIISISVVYFLNMLDTTVLATVRLPVSF